MNHPASPGTLAERHPGALLAVLLALLLVLPTAPPASGGAGGQAMAGVLVFLDDSDYHWADATLDRGSTALCATISACRELDLPLNYSMSQYGAFVTEMGGLKAPADFSWYWYLLLWNGTLGAWKEAPVGASDLGLSPGDSICWCPNSSAPPVPNPVTRYPWPSFRGNLKNNGIASGTVNISRNVAWTADLANGPVDTTPAVANGRVFVSTGGIYNWTTMAYDQPPHLYALNASTGKTLWSAETTAAGWQVSSPAVRNGRVVIGTSDGKVLALSETTGSPLWSFSTGASPTGVTASPVVTADAVYIAAGDGKLYALSPDGKLMWNFSLGGPAYMSTPAISGGRLFAGTDNGTFWCVALNGTPVWNLTVDGKIRCSPVVFGQRVYIVATVYDGWSAARSRIHVREISNGNQAEAPRNMTATTSSPIVLGLGVVYGSSSGIESDDWTNAGHNDWHVGLDGPVQSSLVLAAGAFYVTENSRNGTLRAFVSVKGGTELWNFTPEPRQYLLGSPAVADGLLYFGSDNGKVYAIGGPGTNTTIKKAEPAPFSPSTAMLAAGAGLIVVVAVLVVARQVRAGRGRKDE